MAAPPRPFAHFAGLHARLHYLYAGGGCTCPKCGGGNRVSLAAGNVPGGTDVEAAAREAFNNLFKQAGYTPADLGTQKPYKDLIEATRKTFDGAIEDGKVPPVLAAYLKRDGHIFSGLKAHAQLQEASALLLLPDGQRRPYASFEREVLKLNATYNVNYLEAEYLFAQQSAQSAAHWAQYEADGDRYLLQYRTSQDDKVRATHQPLHNITLALADPFWSSYMPPNGWRCRCRTIQVTRRKNTESDSAVANAAGEVATTEIDKNGNNRLELFRFNPGKDKALMPPGYTYEKVEGAKEAKKVVISTAPPVPVPGKFVIDREVKNIQDLTEVMGEYAKAYPEDFKKGFKSMREERGRGNGSTDCRGTVWLSRERMGHTIDALNNIKKGEETTLKQEDALSTLWHEVLHNKRRNPADGPAGAASRRQMELANEFVSRKTVDSFLEKLGGKLKNESLMLNRDSTGYNSMVNNYDKILAHYEVPVAKALKTISNHLFEEGTYSNQMDGLIQAVAEHSPYKTTGMRKLINDGISYTESWMDKNLEESKSLLVKKKK